MHVEKALFSSKVEDLVQSCSINKGSNILLQQVNPYFIKIPFLKMKEVFCSIDISKTLVVGGLGEQPQEILKNFMFWINL